MKHSAMFKFAVIMSAVLALYLGGCVEVNNPDVRPTDLRSTVRFVNFANMPNSMAVILDRSAATTATVTFQNSSSYMDLPAGPRFWSFVYGGTTDTLHHALTPSTQYTYYSEYEPTNTDTVRTYVLVSERRTFSGAVPFPSGAQVVRFINLSSDTAATVLGGLTFHFMYGTTDTTSDPLTFASASDYYQTPASNSPQFSIVGASGNTLVPATAVGAAAGRYSVVFTGSQAASSWQAKVFQEN
jgi:hypothetical protein